MKDRPDRLTVEDHEGFRKSLTPPVPDPWDEIDELVADAEHDLKPRSHRDTDRVLRILDDLEGKQGRGGI